jgi:hypothetical protein
MQYRPFESGIEVNGQTVFAIVDGFRLFKSIPSEILLTEGIGTKDKDGLVLIEPDAWYPQEAWLRAFERIASQVGKANLFAIGRRIPDNAKFPPSIVTIHDAVASIDVAYHMNHRKHGRVMLDRPGGTMLEGIGHYGYQTVTGSREITSVCENPYPCEFDRGIITAMAKRFERMAVITHDPEAPCRDRGAESCTYHVTW